MQIFSTARRPEAMLGDLGVRLFCYLTILIAVVTVTVTVGVVAGLGVIATLLLVIVAIFVAGMWEHRGRLGTRTSVAGISLRGAGRLLPCQVRECYVEEWQGWLFDLREQGVPWYRRLSAVLSLFLSAIPSAMLASWITDRKAVQ